MKDENMAYRLLAISSELFTDEPFDRVLQILACVPQHVDGVILPNCQFFEKSDEEIVKIVSALPAHIKALDLSSNEFNFDCFDLRSDKDRDRVALKNFEKLLDKLPKNIEYIILADGAGIQLTHSRWASDIRIRYQTTFIGLGGMSPEGLLHHKKYKDVLNHFADEIKQKHPNNTVLNAVVEAFVKSEEGEIMSALQQDHDDKEIAQHIVSRAEKHFGINHKAIRIVADMLMIAFCITGIGLLAIGIKKATTNHCFFYIGKQEHIEAKELLERDMTTVFSPT